MIDYPTKYYTGVGSRSTPEDVLEQMTSFAQRLHLFGYTLRSGGASGADIHFEIGSLRNEIYLPWKSFNDNDSELYGVCDEALCMAEDIHPNWSACSQGARKLHARNIYQVLGKDLDSPSEFVIYWAKESDGEVSGGTRTAVVCARQHGIPTYNLKFDVHQSRLNRKLYRLYVRHMVTTLKHLSLFFIEGIDDDDLVEIDRLVVKDKLSKDEINIVKRLFNKYKKLDSDPAYLPTEYYNLS